MTVRRAALLVVLPSRSRPATEERPAVGHGGRRSRIGGADRPDDIRSVLLPLVCESSRTACSHGEACRLPEVDCLVRGVSCDERPAVLVTCSFAELLVAVLTEFVTIQRNVAPLSALTVAGVV